MKDLEKARIFRERFHGRPDVFGNQWQTQREDGTTIKGYTPDCENHWTEKCHLRLKDDISCSDCEIQKFRAVSDQTVLRHIKGEEPQMHYMLQTDGTIMFGAFDFDYKPGKEHLGYSFKDVKRVVAVLKEWGMPYALARSTGNGYHLYFFMEEFYPARKFRSIIWEIMDRCGFMMENMTGIRPLPEVFPKQNFIGESGLGNGIKPPMIETNFAKQRNCLIDDDDQMIPSSQQWEYLDSIPRVKTKFMDDLIEKLQIPLEPDHNVSLKGRGTAGPGGITGRKGGSGPVNGSIEKVMEGCMALRNLRDKMKNQNYSPSHFEGTALWHLSMNTLDGKDWFIDNVPGWGKDSSGLKQLQHSVNRGYSPWTCRKMQESGVCPVGTKCFDKKPPVEYVEGKAVVRHEVPESEWPEPSPIRYAFGKGEDFLKKLMDELNEVAKLDNEEQRAIQITAIIARASVFDDTQQSVLKAHIEKLKIAKKSDINKIFNRANANRDEKVNQASSQSGDYFMVGGVTYRYLDFGYSKLIPGKRGTAPMEQVLANCFIDFIEERTVVDDNRASKRKIMFGKFTSQFMSTDFEINAETWSDNNESYKFFIKLCGIAMQFKKSDMETIRQIVHFTAENGRAGMPPCKKTVYYSAPGWYDGTYITPSVIIDRNGIKPNTEKPVDNTGKEHAGNIDFKLLTDQEFMETLFHLKTDFMKAFNPDHVKIATGYTLMTSIHSYLSIPWRPTLWLEGTTGAGKTGFSIALQNFYGTFKGGVNWTTTEKSMLDYAYQFKDTMMLADDFKARSPQEIKACSSLIQNSYDFSVRGAMSKDGEQRGDKYSRTLFLMTGEEIPEGHASVIARMIILECPQMDMTLTQDAYREVEANMHNYKGVTPRFIHWILNKDRAMIQKFLGDAKDALQKPIAKAQNSSRVSFNIALAHTGWNYFLDFMVEHGAMSFKEAQALKEESWNYCEILRNKMIVRCKEQQNANIFLSTISELLMTGKASIKYLDGFDQEHGTEIGFVDNKDAEPHVCYIYPSVTVKFVKENVSSSNFVISPNSAGTQLKEMGILKKTDEANGKTQITKRFNNSVMRVWCVDLTKLGINRSPRVVGQTEPIPFTPVDQPLPDSSGLI